MSRVLAPGECAALDAVPDRLIPEDEHGPGAVEMGATVAVLRALDGDLHAQVPAVRAALRSLAAGLPGSDPASQNAALAGLQNFAGSDPAVQDAALARLETEQPAAFALLRSLVLEGVFGDPAYGGNVGGAGWRLLSYEGPRLVVTADDQAIRDLP